MANENSTIKRFSDIFREEIREINKRRASEPGDPRGTIKWAVEEEATRPAPTGKLKAASDGAIPPPATMSDENSFPRPAPESRIVGLALSGGGIRSSAFCLGALQGLDNAGVLERVDYLSTVSGGGYIGMSTVAAMSPGGGNGDFPFKSELKQRETAGVQHIRDHVNYLFPSGIKSLFGNLAVYLRGVAANLVLLVLPFLLLAASLTVPFFALDQNLGSRATGGYSGTFGLTAWALGICLVLLAGWAWCRSGNRNETANDSEVGVNPKQFGWLLALAMLVPVAELQQILIAAMYESYRYPGQGGNLAEWLKTTATFLAPVAAVAGYFGNFLAATMKKSDSQGWLGGFGARVLSKGIMILAGAAVPLILWVVYLYICVIALDVITEHRFGCAGIMLVSGALFGLSTLLWLIGWRLEPNANSLHQLYRERLGQSFLFNPNPASAQGGSTPLPNLKVSGLLGGKAPYPLINTAVNIAGSALANRRGRNADFFLFSPKYAGSETTGYVAMHALEEKAPDFTAGSAMAISGAAASSNMGSATIKALAPTLAILNIRLGYWLKNPRFIADEPKAAALTFKESALAQFYFLNEMLGWLSEDSPEVYLTDGGHIDNLGLYELLRRRCKLIVVVDAEADPEMSFNSFVKVQRYARIDLGTRIDLPWAALRDSNKFASEQIAETGGVAFVDGKRGPHCALGRIEYPVDRDGSPNTGVILYVKSMLTGDENDYIIDYKRRYRDFPHETTLDQFFSEEQFEVYRALGFHAVQGAFGRRDIVSMPGSVHQWKGILADEELEREMRDALQLGAQA